MHFDSHTGSSQNPKTHNSCASLDIAIITEIGFSTSLLNAVYRYQYSPVGYLYCFIVDISLTLFTMLVSSTLTFLLVQMLFQKLKFSTVNPRNIKRILELHSLSHCIIIVIIILIWKRNSHVI